MYSHRFVAFQLHLFFWIILVLGLYILDLTTPIFIVLPISIVDLWLALCLGFMLRLPTSREDVGAPEGWAWEQYQILDYPVRWLAKEIDPSKPMAILVHGWNSRAMNMIGRAELYQQCGYNCVLFEMRAHGGNKKVQHWAAMHVCYDLEQTLSLFQKRGWLSNGFLIHGHSLGGFVAQRALRPSLDTSDNAIGIILESPVTSYELINNQTCEYLKIPSTLHRPMMNRLLRYYNLLNPSHFAVSSITMLSTPEWGMPSCPTLLVQAKFDATLGRKHADLLIDVHNNRQTEFKYHIVEDLKHAYEKNNSTRDSLISKWMEEHSLLFS
ncbi:MAG: alpha/beta hydrolase [Candidatus Poseidoniales archaeon]|nr:alpha/beta hydrolase [Candidatus Poseidoniales archaeon]